jgi:hypothetical protein
MELKEFLRNTYVEKRTLDFHANQLFRAKQNKNENVAEYIQRVQTLGSRFRESALLNCGREDRSGTLNLADRLRNICFIQGLYSDKIQTIVRSRNNEHFDEIGETALEEESAIVSKQERYRGDTVSPVKCGNCGKSEHPSSKCYARKDIRVNQVKVDKPGQSKEVICFRCNIRGHYAKDCRRAVGKFNKKINHQEKSGNENRLSANSHPTVSPIQ